MLAELNSILLNEILNAFLFIILILFYVNSLLERRIKQSDRDYDFSMFILSCSVYVGLMLPWLYIQFSETEKVAKEILLFIRLFSAMMAYYYITKWLLGIIEENKQINFFIKISIQYSVIFLFILSYILSLLGYPSIISNIPILSYYLILEFIVLYFHREFGTKSTIILTLFIIPLLFVQAQEAWNYTPANMYLVLCIIVIYSRIWMEDKEKYLIVQKKIEEHETKLLNYKTEIIIRQIGPHFIYNTLSTIAALCTMAPLKAQQLTVDFANYLRNGLNFSKMHQISSFEEELNHTRQYLNIEKVRFGKRLNIEYDIREMNFSLPTLSLQPIVENAVKHGVTQKPKGGTIRIATEKRDMFFAVVISDDGVGCSSADLQLQAGHYGLSTAKERLQHLNGTITVESTQGQGTTVTILIKDTGGKQSEDCCC